MINLDGKCQEIALKILYKIDVEDTYANIAVRDALKHSILNGLTEVWLRS